VASPTCDNNIFLVLNDFQTNRPPRAGVSVSVPEYPGGDRSAALAGEILNLIFSMLKTVLQLVHSRRL
jgi:hypothetical protein